jgi:hypothetical protein
MAYRNIVPVANGGTGGATAGAALTNLGAVGVTGNQNVGGIKTFTDNVVMSAGKALGWSDVSLSRAAAQIMDVGGLLRANGFTVPLNGAFQARNHSGENTLLLGGVASEAQHRIELSSGGLMRWGGGATTVDTNLYRSAVSTLRTDHVFVFGATVSTGAASYSVLAPDRTIYCDTTSNSVTIVTPASPAVGRRLTIKHLTGNAAVNNVIIDPPDSATVDGDLTAVIAISKGSLTIEAGSAGNWHIVASHLP